MPSPMAHAAVDNGADCVYLGETVRKLLADEQLHALAARHDIMDKGLDPVVEREKANTARAAKRAVVDVMGVTLAGHNAPGIAPVVEQMRETGGKPEATYL